MKRYIIGSGFEIGEVVKNIKKFMFSANTLTMGYSTKSSHGPYEDSGLVRGDANPLKNSVGKINKVRMFTILPPTEDGSKLVTRSSRNTVAAVIRSGDIVARVGIGDTIWMDNDTCVIQHAKQYKHSAPELKEFVIICRGGFNPIPNVEDAV